MTIHNETPFEHGLAIGLGPDRQPHLGVIVKATYAIPERSGGPVEPAAEQLEVSSADEYTKGDVTGSMRTESETVVFKPRADVVLIGHAYAPNGRAVTALEVGLRVGRKRHTMRVVGDRRWSFPSKLAVVPEATTPEPFTAMPLVYERSFGGFDHEGRAWAKTNPIGRGFIVQKTRESVDGRRLPNLEDPARPVRSWDDHPDPVGWGFFGRSWQPRARLSGVRTDDLDPTFGLPSDFDHAFYNGAHPALQMPALEGDEEIELVNVTPDGLRRFRLPGWHPAITLRIRPRKGSTSRPPVYPFEPVLDTLVLFPDGGVFTLTWRSSRPLTTDIETAIEQIGSIQITEAGPSSTSAREA
ncbi:DUF2169 family type VI secretion system accessory protein [Rubrivirga sp.]|uniref:DUF2169 family type VI secretion system accessory protein n=1 Tax=Rubrivirga sp. TaxID=1885344 RepID=UPI003C750EFE